MEFFSFSSMDGTFYHVSALQFKFNWDNKKKGSSAAANTLAWTVILKTSRAIKFELQSGRTTCSCISFETIPLDGAINSISQYLLKMKVSYN
jgi:hypothetical protein